MGWNNPSLSSRGFVVTAAGETGFTTLIPTNAVIAQAPCNKEIRTEPAATLG
jgi:hypothetical protein